MNLVSRFLPERGAAREAVLLSMGTQIEAVLSFVTVAVLTHSTSLTTAGQVFFAQGLAALVFLFLDPRLEDTLQRYAAILESRDRRGAVTTLFVRCLQLDVLIAIAAGFLFVGGAVVATTSHDATFQSTFVALALVNAALQAPVGTAMAGYAVTFRLVTLAKLRIALALVSATTNVIAIVLGGATAYLLANAVTTGVATLIIAAGAWRGIVRKFGRSVLPERGELHGIIGFTIKSSLATSVQASSDQVLYTVAGAAGGAAFLARLRVASAPGRFVVAAASPVSSVLFPRTSRLAAREDTEGVRALQQKAASRLAPLSACIAIGSIFGMRYLVPVAYGNAYKSVSTAAALFAIAGSIRIITCWSKTLLIAVGRPGLRVAVVAAESIVLVAATAFCAHGKALTTLASINVVVAAALCVWWFALLRWDALVARVPSRHAPTKNTVLVDS